MPGAEQFFSYTAQQGTMIPGHSLVDGADYGLGPLGNPLASMAASAMMGQVGLSPSQFFPMYNLADLTRADMLRTRQQAAVTKAMATTDVNNWLDTTGGAMRMLGLPFGLDQRSAFRQTYAAATPILSVLAQMAPELVDSLHGSRGSAAILASNLFQGGQYRLDASGSLGLGAESIQGLQRTITDQLYSSPTRISAMRGVGMGQLGAIFDESARRGYLPGSIGARSRDAQVAALAGSGMKMEDIQALDEAQFGEKLRNFDAKRVAGRLKEMAGAVSAMRELFGSQGQANAPMSQIINALEAITQNRLASMSATQVEALVRKTKAVAENTGMGIDGLLHLTAQSAAMGDGLGMDRQLAMRIGLSSASYGAGYRNAFGSSFTAFGAASPDEVVARDVKLRTQAAMSEQARFGGAFLRSMDALGVDENTQAGRLAKALRSGATTFEGQSMFRVLTQSNLTKIMQGSGVNAAGVQAFTTALGDEFGNQEYIEKHGLEKMVRKLQGEELASNAGRIAGEGAVQQALVAAGVPQEQAAKQARAVGGGLLRTMFDSENPELLSTAAGRRQMIEQELAKTMGAAQARKLAPSVALSFEARMNAQAKFYGYGDFTKMLQSQNRMAIEQGEFAEKTAEVDAEVAKAMSPLGKAGPVQRIIDLVQAGNSDEDIMKTMGKALGGVDLAGVRELSDAHERYRQLATKPKKTAADLEEMQVLRRKIRSQVGNIVTGASPELRAFMKDADEGKSRDELEATHKDKLRGLGVDNLLSLRRARERAEELEGRPRTAEEELELEAHRKTIDTVEKQITDSGLADSVGRQVSDADMARAAGGFRKLEEAMADKDMDATKRERIIDREARHGLARANNIVQALYVDPASLRKLGVGGVRKLKSVEGQYTQVLRLVNGDTELLKKALAGDPSVPESVRKQVQAMMGQLGADMAELEEALAGEGSPMTPEQAAAEKEELDKLYAERNASDEDQKKSLLERLAKVSGLDLADMSDEEKARLSDLMGSHGSAKRKDLLLAMEARESIDRAVKEHGMTREELRDAGWIDSELAQAGALGELESSPGGDAITDVERALASFGSDKPKAAQQAKPKIEMTGTLTIKDDGTASIAAEGITDMGGMA